MTCGAGRIRGADTVRSSGHRDVDHSAPPVTTVAEPARAFQLCSEVPVIATEIIGNDPSGGELERIIHGVLLADAQDTGAPSVACGSTATRTARCCSRSRTARPPTARRWRNAALPRTTYRAVEPRPVAPANQAYARWHATCYAAHHAYEDLDDR